MNDHAIRSESLVESFGDAEYATVDSDILTEDEHAVITFHFLDECKVDRLYEREICHWSFLFP